MATEKKSTKREKKPQPFERVMEALKTFVRTRGKGYLQDPNITSVGIGYKIKDGKRTDQLSIQFTVASKAKPEDLDELDTTPIPASFEIDGLTVPTDVLQRTYVPSYRLVREEVPGPRKQRVDPILPGISIANRRISAGTLGCIVYDRVTGSPYVLSNWHVLHGPEGQIGDNVVQPGRHDDNRVSQNRAGKLVRSHLGAAGDCAISTIEDREFQVEILELSVTPRRLAEPQLDDTVIKSGRTTGVTRGIVTRVNTIASIDYEGECRRSGHRRLRDRCRPGPSSGRWRDQYGRRLGFSVAHYR
jgi:endonuclease G